MTRASKAAFSNTRIIPDLLSGKGARSPKCCDRGIMRGSRHGESHRPRPIHGYGDRIFGSAMRVRGSSLPLARGRRRTNDMNVIQTIEAENIAKFLETKKIPEFRPGDTLKVGVKVVEGERTRVQNYEGVCIARSNKGMGSNFTVRKISFGEGVERVFPLYSPNVDSIEVVRKGVVRRAKLYYLRGRTGKSARIAERR